MGWLVAVFLLSNFASAETDLRMVAEKELAISWKNQSSDVLPTPATVRTNIEPVLSPVRYTALQIGVSYQPFAPQGQAIAGGQASQKMTTTSQPGMIALDVRWLPFELADFPFVYLGGFGSLGYSRSELSVRSAGGNAYKNTYAHSLKTQFGFATEFHLPRNPRLSLAASCGLGRLELVQASDSAFASGAEKLFFGSAGALAQYRLWGPWTVYGGYEYRRSLQRQVPRIGVEPHNILIGFLGSVN